MSQIDVNIIAPLGYTGPALSGDSNFVQIIDNAGDTIFKAPGSGNVFIGNYSGYNLSSGGGNTCLGNASGGAITVGNSNTCIGNGAGGSITIGMNNTFIGSNTGGSYPTITGSNNICIGTLSNPSTSSVFNEITLGNSSITTLRCAVTSITSLSDARDKKEVSPIEVGLEFVKELNPVKFVWDDRREEGKHDIADSGFIAQELKSLEDKYNAADVLKLVYDENPDRLEASYGRLIPVLVKAIQELTAKVEALEAK